MHCDGFANDEAILNKFTDGLARIGVRDFANFVGVKPDFAFAATYDGCRKAFLSTEVDPNDGNVSMKM